jgi:hypothetical protein
VSDQLPHDEDLRTLYRKLPADEPRAEIDEAILAAARAQIHERQRARFLERLRWAMPLAAAASIAVTLTLIRVAPKQTPLPAAQVDGEVETLQTKAAKQTRPPAAGSASSSRDEGHDSQPREDIDEARTLEQKKKADGPLMAAPALRGAAPQPPAAVPAAPQPDAEARAKSPASAKPPAEQFATTPGAPHAAPPSAAPPPAPSAAPPAIPSPAAPEARARRGVSDSLKGLGYITGSEPASKEASPAASGNADSPAPPPPATGEAAAPRDDLRSSVQDQLQKANDARAKSEVTAELHDDQLADKKDAFASDDLARRRAEESDSASERAKPEAGTLAGSVPAQPAAWPFRLEPGLEAEESCRRVAAMLKTSCNVSSDTATISLAKPQTISTGEFAGSKVSRVRLLFRNGKLWKISLLLEGYKTEQVLVAPASAVDAPPPASPAR